MRVSELARRSDLSVATIKFYLREGLLHPGEVVTRTQSDYDDTHLERLRLIRALIGVGGLSIAAVRSVLQAIDDPSTQRTGLMEAAQRAVTGLQPTRQERYWRSPPTTRTRAWLHRRGWRVDPADPLVDELDAAWDATDLGHLGLDTTRLDAYADAMEQIARVDVDTVPEDRAAAVKQVVLGTVLLDPLLLTLRRLAHQHVAATMADEAKVKAERAAKRAAQRAAKKAAAPAKKAAAAPASRKAAAPAKKAATRTMARKAGGR